MSEPSRTFSRGRPLSSCMLAVLASAAAPAWGQPAQGDQPAAAAGGLEEIVVTAERRTTNLQTTPLAISAIQADTLQKENINQFADINGRVPSLEITHSSGYETIVTIRGVGLETPENAPTTSPGVSFFMDGVYIANTISLDQTLFDIDHIEILRGPQGALYGQSSTGGAINVTTQQPKLGEFSGKGDVTIGDYALHRERGEINIPLGDTFAIRASAQNYGHDGFTKNVTLGTDLDDANDVSGKIAILWKPIDEFTATLSTQFYSADTNGQAQKNILDPNEDPWTVSQDYPARFALNTNVTHLNLQYDTPWFTVKSVTAYQYLKHVQQEDSSRSTFAQLHTYDDVAAWNTHMQNYNEEFDILSNGETKLDWITGVFLLSQKSRQFVVEYECPSQVVFFCAAPPTAAQLAVPPNIEFSPPPKNLVFGQNILVDRKSYSWFAQATYHITDDLRLTGGVRVNYDSYDGFGHNFNAGLANPLSRVAFSANSYWDLVPTWRGEVDYNVTPDNMIYASASRGYKPGGLNTPGGLFTTVQFQPETNTAFEVGAKNQFMDRHLRLNVAGFYYIYKNMQYIATDPVEFAGGVENIPSIHIWGAEAEANYTGGPEDRMHIDASLSLEDGEIEGTFRALDSTIQQRLIQTAAPCMFGGAFFNPACFTAELAAIRNVGGNQPAKMPGILGSLAFSYDLPIRNGMLIPPGILTPRLDIIYRGSFWQRIFAEPAVDRVPDYAQVNLNFEYIPNDSNLTVQLSITNFFDVAGINSRYTDPYGTFTTSQQYIPPRQIMGTVGYSF